MSTFGGFCPSQAKKKEEDDKKAEADTQKFGGSLFCYGALRLRSETLCADACANAVALKSETPKP